MAQAYFITGIGTDVGKTLASAVIVKALNAEYWKPLQCGDLENTDSMKVAQLTGCVVHDEAYKLQRPMSPHAAAEAEGVAIDLLKIQLPKHSHNLVVEGAGGLLVPLNDCETIIDLIKHLNLPAILVSRHYLGSINHTLLSLELLKQRGVTVAGVLFNGEENLTTESIIQKHTGVRILGRIPVLKDITPTSVTKVAADFQLLSLQHS